ncbi:MAG: NFACT RNA binding domain-containing protein [Gemmatimonadota bacterium]|nr:NFACT RNA binding domain-containing protein [Gemmatimonadota bacterium]
MDSLTVHYVARELGERWRGRRIVACQVDPVARTLTMWCEGNAPVCFDLRALAVREVAGAPSGTLLAGWSITDVGAPMDERRFLIHAERGGKFRGSRARAGTIEVSFIPNGRGAQVKESRHTLAAAGGPLPPVAEPRPVLEDSEVRRTVDARDANTLVRARWMSGDICDALFAQPERAAELYRWINSLPPAAPSQCGDRVFPLPLCKAPRSLASLILPPMTPEGPSVPAPSDKAMRVIARMRKELERAREGPRLRAAADMLMALGPGAAVPPLVRLPDGSNWSVPAAHDGDAIELAERLYKEARKMERALEELPPRIAALEAAPTSSSSTKRRTAPVVKADTKRLPYRSYRSSGGIEILVGRGARSNDELTYDIARPDDVWLHARDLTGAHVVMRWTQKGPPPSRDLHEAAALAAWHSRARGSTVVPVDWTRRRHVRRARGGPPGRAIVERAKTVMARPTPELERRLRVGADAIGSKSKDIR